MILLVSPVVYIKNIYIYAYFFHNQIKILIIDHSSFQNKKK